MQHELTRRIPCRMYNPWVVITFPITQYPTTMATFHKITTPQKEKSCFSDLSWGGVYFFLCSHLWSKVASRKSIFCIRWLAGCLEGSSKGKAYAIDELFENARFGLFSTALIFLTPYHIGEQTIKMTFSTTQNYKDVSTKSDFQLMIPEPIFFFI